MNERTTNAYWSFHLVFGKYFYIFEVSIKNLYMYKHPLKLIVFKKKILNTKNKNLKIIF